jgi:hypothetical protein
MAKNNRKRNGFGYSISQLFNFAPESYLERTSRPIYGIIFLLPFILFYEFAVIFVKTDVLNQSVPLVDAFVWLQKGFAWLGFGGKFVWLAPPLAVVAILTGLQLASGKKWRFFLADLCPMGIECILLAVPLIVFSLFLNSSANPQNDIAFFHSSTDIHLQAAQTEACSPATCYTLASRADNNSFTEGRATLTNIIAGIGAGIYEELVFRLILICLLMLVFQDLLRLGHVTSIVLSVLISAALFSASHHIDFLSGQLNPRDAFSITKFLFRIIAGVYFAVLFAFRGFGITAGTHAFYNIIAVFINAFFFQR